METQAWCLPVPTGSVGEGWESPAKEQWPLPALLSESCPSSPRAEAGPFSSSLHVRGAFQAAAPVLDLKAS